MAQVLPETSNSNVWQNIAERATGGYLRGREEAKAEGKEAQKNALLSAITDPKKTPIERTSAQEQFLAKFGKPSDLIEFQKLQDSRLAFKDYENAKYGGTQNVLDNTPQNAEANPIPQGNLTPNQNGQQINNAEQLFQGNQQNPALQDKSAAPQNPGNQGQVNNAIAKIAKSNPQLAGVLQKQENQAYKNEQEQERLVGKSYEMSQDYRERVIANDSSYDKTNMILDRALEISNSREPEEISKPAFVALMQKLGIPTAAWGSSTEEEIDKLSNELTKNIPEGWKGKILQSEFHSLLRTLPNLLNSPEGMQLIVRNMKLLMEPFRLEYDIMNGLKKEYQTAGKKLPYDFQDQVYERMKPAMKKLHEEFVKGTDEAIAFSERMSQGGTVGRQKEKKGQKVIQKQNENLPPVKPGFVRMEREGKIFDFPQDQAQKRKDFGFKPL